MQFIHRVIGVGSKTAKIIKKVTTEMFHCRLFVLSPLLFAIYVDDLISELGQSGYGLHIGSLFIGSILYADDIALLACSCYGLQQLINSCNNYGMQCDIIFNSQKSQLACSGGNSPRHDIITLGDVYLSWSVQIKYLGCCFRGNSVLVISPVLLADFMAHLITFQT